MRTLNIRFKPFVGKLLMELIDCWQRKTPQLLQVESAYMITLKHWKEVRSECWQRSFECEDEEIDFFKHIKCQFTGRLAYFTILYEALVSVPQDANDTFSFWQNELQRFHRFETKNRDFIRYLDGGENHLDEIYFLRKNLSAVSHTPAAKLYDGEPDFCTQSDHLVSAYFAEKLYKHYVLGCISN